MKFQNPTNNYAEESTLPWLWALLFGVFYFAIKGAWAHVFIGTMLALITFGISWLIYPFFATGIVRATYLRKGWTEL